ncbi:hypothetical protein AB9F35_36835, partial [Rhizobium leguminosarum]
QRRQRHTGQLTGQVLGFFLELRYTKASINNQQMVAGLMPSFQYNIEAIAALHVTKEGRDWMANLAKMSLKEYLAFRD